MKNKQLNTRVSDQELKTIKKAQQALNAKNTSDTIRKAMQYVLQHKQA